MATSAREEYGYFSLIVDSNPVAKAVAEGYRQLGQELIKLMGERPGLTIVVEGGAEGAPVRVSVSGYTSKELGAQNLTAQRKFHPEEKLLLNDMMKIPSKLRKNGLADLINAAGAKGMDAMGITRVELLANIDIGGYAWARKGFWPMSGRGVWDGFVNGSSLSSELKTKWASMTDAELKAFVLTDDFRDYRDAFLNRHWNGAADISDPVVRAAFTGQKPPPDLVPAATANEIYRDAAIRNQIGVRRYSQGLTRRISSALEQADAELAAKLRERLATFAGSRVDVTSQRWKALLADIQKSRREVLGGVEATAQRELQELSTQEATRELNMLQTAVPIEISFAAVAAPQLEAIVESKPFQGRLLADWFFGLKVGDASRLTQALQLGMLEGEPIDSIVRRIVGTRANQYTDGILSITRRDATAIVRTAINHVSNEARGAVWEANDDIISAKVWTATLDGRTTVLCASRDGKGVPVGDNPLPEGVEPLTPPNATPPAHMNCRSVMVALIDGLGLIGDRPVVVDTRTRKQREVDFRALAKESGKTIQEIRAEWAARVVGRVPSTTTYEQFLRRQSLKFQEEVLGVTKAQLFRNGGLRLDQFVDRAGNELTLEELAKTAPEAFKRIH